MTEEGVGKAARQRLPGAIHHEHNVRHPGQSRVAPLGEGNDLVPVLSGALVHALLRANQYDLSMRTLGDLLRDGANLHAGGLLSGGLYILLEWAFSSIGALILVLAALCADLMVALRLTPGVIWEAIRRPADYEYESEEERAYYEDPISLPNVRAEIAAGTQVTVVCGGRTFKADCDVSDRQRGALLAGGTLNYARQQSK